MQVGASFVSDGGGASQLGVGMWGMGSRLAQLSSFPPKFHPDNNRKACLTSTALKYLSVKGQVLGSRSSGSRATASENSKAQYTVSICDSCLILKEHSRPFEGSLRNGCGRGCGGRKSQQNAFRHFLLYKCYILLMPADL